jgi:formylglycine-generating enzyme required for sulfatase activity
MDADGENETRVTNNIVDDHNPAWSPDGSRIVYQSYVGGNWEIYVMDANGDNQVWLTNNSVDDQKPKWSPDGTQIVFQSYCDGYEQIYIMNSDGTQQNRITYPDAYLYNNNAASWLFKEPSDTPYFIVGGEPIMLNDPVPEGIACPMGVNDNGDIDGNGSQYIPSPVTIEYDYVVGETEVTYRQWKDVYNWATDPARGAERYYFANAGVQGCGASTTDLHPVTTINWRDAIVWCNALTEYCNKDNVAKLECAYHANAGFSSPHRSSVYEELLHAGDGEIDNPHVNASAGGFRLLTGDEWELAARFISPGVYYHGNFASGADDVYYVSPATSDYDGDGYFASSANVAVYAAVNGGGAGTAVVRSKRPNAMGLYDMGGNVWEWCFDPSPSSISGERLRIGGGFNHTSYHLQIGERYSGKGDPWNAAGDVGFRVTRTVVE